MENETPSLPSDFSGTSNLDSLKEGATLPRDSRRFKQFLGRQLTELLGTLEKQLTDDELQKATEALTTSIEYGGRAVQALATVLIRLDQSPEQRASRPMNPAEVFKQLITSRLALDKMLRQRKRKSHSAFDKLLENPIAAFFTQVKSLVWQRRLLRRYLRSRFGVKHTPAGRFFLRRRRSAREAPSAFGIWLGKRMSDDHQFVEGEVEKLFSQWLAEQRRDSMLLSHVQNHLISCEAKFILWLAMSNHDPSMHDPKLFVAGALKIMEAVHEELPLSMLHSKVTLRKYFDDERVNMLADIALAELSALVISHTSLELNRGAAEALKTDGKDSTIEPLLDRVPADLRIALEEKEPGEGYLQGNGQTSVLSRVNRMLKDDQPLEAKSEELRQGRLRKDRTVSDSPDSEGLSSPGKNRTGGANRDEFVSNDFRVREEARSDLTRLRRKANLSPREQQVFELMLQDRSEADIAKALDVKLGTASALKATAMKKLRKAAGR